MGFGDAIKSVFTQYVGFNGRARRSEYWYFTLFNSMVGLVLALISIRALSVIWSLVVLLPGLAVMVRRLHDIGRSGWWYLIVLIPIVGAVVLIVFFCTDSQPGENKWGKNPKETYFQSANNYISYGALPYNENINTKTCPVCGKPVKESAKFCTSCGSQIPEIAERLNAQKICSSCGAEMDKDAMFCTECGTRVIENPSDSMTNEKVVATCSGCGAVYEDTIPSFCPSCGSKL